MVLYAGMIPLVPLCGYEYYKKRKNLKRQLICLGLFALQLLISGAAVYQKFFA